MAVTQKRGRAGFGTRQSQTRLVTGSTFARQKCSDDIYCEQQHKRGKIYLGKRQSKTRLVTGNTLPMLSGTQMNGFLIACRKIRLM